MLHNYNLQSMYYNLETKVSLIHIYSILFECENTRVHLSVCCYNISSVHLLN